MKNEIAELTQLTKFPELDNFARELKENGFTVIIGHRDELDTWFHFFKDGKMGYVQKSYYGGWDFSSTHKPSRENGTGFGVLDMAELTIDNANKAINSHGWSVKETQNVKKWQSPEEFINSTHAIWAKYAIL